MADCTRVVLLTGAAALPEDQAYRHCSCCDLAGGQILPLETFSSGCVAVSIAIVAFRTERNRWSRVSLYFVCLNVFSCCLRPEEEKRRKKKPERAASGFVISASVGAVAVVD